MALVFGCAGRLDLPFVWATLVVNQCFVFGSFFLLDPGLLQERRSPAPGGLDRGPLLWSIPSLVVHHIIAALDVGRFQWSAPMGVGVQAMWLLGVAGSLALSFWALKTNRFFSPVVRIQNERGHHLVTDGPYRWVRHPGYVALLVCFVCRGPALGSWWAALPLLPLVFLLMRRIKLEDRFLGDNLEGYPEYQKRVRYKLIPGIW